MNLKTEPCAICRTRMSRRYSVLCLLCDRAWDRALVRFNSSPWLMASWALQRARRAHRGGSRG